MAQVFACRGLTTCLVYVTGIFGTVCLAASHERPGKLVSRAAKRIVGRTPGRGRAHPGWWWLGAAVLAFLWPDLAEAATPLAIGGGAVPGTVAGLTGWGAGALVAGVAVSVRRRPRLPGLLTDRRWLREMAEVAPVAVLICDGAQVIVANAAARTMLPLGDPEGRMLNDVLPGDPGDGLAGGSGAWLSRRDVECGGRTLTVLALSDQGARQRLEAEVERLRSTDPLTGLMNRLRFQEIVQARIGRGAPFALLRMGLDRFKSLNDSMGHVVGDRLLTRFAARLAVLRPDALALGRLGGDQFGLLLEGDDPARLQLLGTRLVEVMTRWLQTEGRAPNVGVSAGFAMAPADGCDEEALNTCAELALRRAKDEGRGICRPYPAGLAEEARRRAGLELSLREAVAQRQFVVHFQPQVNLQTGAFTGAEALVRWRHPLAGVMSPSEFLPIAEETGLIDEIGEWVLRTACEAAAGWPDPLRVAVNLSPVQFRNPELAARFARIVAETGFPPQRLDLEVTESVLLQDEPRTLRTLRQLRAMGVRIALDDFGTGYSSLSYLRRFPFDKIKLDKSFIAPVPDDAGDSAIVSAILALGRSLGMATVAEGVETERQSAFVAAHGCTQAQGWLIGRPTLNEHLPEAFRPRLA